LKKVFICYRRDDSAGYAGWLRESLLRYLPAEWVFRDIESVSTGLYQRQVSTRLAECDVVLVLIGPQWLSAARGDGTRRLDELDDHVRIEIRSALSLAQGDASKRIVPIQLDGAPLPKVHELPEDLRDLLRWQSLEMGSANMQSAVEKLVREIAGSISVTATSLIEGGTEAKSSRYGFGLFFAQGREFILTGTNFGDQMGNRGEPPTEFHQLVVKTLKRPEAPSIFLVLAPFELLKLMVENAYFDLKARSAARLQMLARDPRLTQEERSRLHIFDHRGATFLSVAIRDPGTGTQSGLAVATPRWFGDQTGPHRMFFAIQEHSAPLVFKRFIEPIYSSIRIDEARLSAQADRTLGGRSVEQICQALNVPEDPFMPSLQTWELNA